MEEREEEEFLMHRLMQLAAPPGVLHHVYDLKQQNSDGTFLPMLQAIVNLFELKEREGIGQSEFLKALTDASDELERNKDFYEAQDVQRRRSSLRGID